MPRDTWWNLPAEKRERVARAAMVEFGERGFSAGSLNVIAREAGIAKGSLFQYFDDKLDLFSTICEAASVTIQEAVLDGVDPDGGAPFFPTMRRVVRNWLRYFRTHPVERGIAFAANSEVDADARAAVRAVTNTHYRDAFRPLVKRAADRGEFRPGTDPDQVTALLILVLRHLDVAPFYPHLDPVLGLYDKSDAEVERVALELVGAVERAYAAEGRGGIL